MASKAMCFAAPYSVKSEEKLQLLYARRPFMPNKLQKGPTVAPKTLSNEEQRKRGVFTQLGTTRGAVAPSKKLVFDTHSLVR